MAKIAQDIALEMNKKAGAVVSKATAIRLSLTLRKVITDLVIKRTMEGYDVLSRKFGGYNRSYNKKKSFKYAARKYGTTKYSSTKSTDKLRLTGNLMSSIFTRTKSIKQTKNQLLMQFIIDVAGSLNKKKAEGLQSTTGVARNRKRYSKKDWRFLGLATSGAYKKKETELINKAVSKYLTKITKTKVSV